MSPESVLAERAQLANRIFRFSVGAVLTFFLALLAQPPDLQHSLGLALFLLTLTVLGGLCLHRLHPGVFEQPASFNKFVFLILLVIGVYRLLGLMGWSPLLVPLPMFAMICALAYAQDTALLSVLALGFILGLTSSRLGALPDLDAFPDRLPLLLRLDLPLSLVVTAGAVTAVLGVRSVRKQSKPVLVGFYCGLVQAVLAVAIQLMSPGFYFDGLRDAQKLQDFLRDPGWAFAGGLISGAVVTCLLPPIERFFDFVTDRRLLELADPSNELLRHLREKAPGTYQHTLNVAQLAGNAAEAIGVDRLLAEVGTFYHDVGKIAKPEYFVENMGEDRSIHDRLRPSMSKMIIIGHVKEGIAFAKDERLPQKLIDMIPMHHGTTVVEYFYQKARRAMGDEEDSPSDTDFRYPGPKPRFKEAGILMLADMVEAIAKTETEPNPSRFRAMVHDQILKRLLDGQLDESDLTLNDLRVIEDSFVRTLATMYHARIKYPGPEGTPRRGPQDGPPQEGPPQGLQAGARLRRPAAL
ncbi:MAG: HDIG domain-containing protein [Planctomycetes bacterium]|nr:HDIG domain-containing protein [Planctomycetota bacterium]